VIEKIQGKALIDYAVANKVKFFLYASVDRGGDKSEGTATPVAQFSSKNDIESYLFDKAGAMKWVILRPTTFMEVSLSFMQSCTKVKILINLESHSRHARQDMGIRL
jgi:NmrA-like family